MRSDGSSTARYRAWMSRHRLTLCDRDHDRLTADIDRDRRQSCLARDRCREPWACRARGFSRPGGRDEAYKLRW
jgi:hypothetical protein